MVAGWTKKGDLLERFPFFFVCGTGIRAKCNGRFTYIIPECISVLKVMAKPTAMMTTALAMGSR